MNKKFNISMMPFSELVDLDDLTGCGESKTWEELTETEQSIINDHLKEIVFDVTLLIVTPE